MKGKSKLDKHKMSIEEVSKMKWEKPQLVILMRDPEMAAGNGIIAYAGLRVGEIEFDPCSNFNDVT